MAIGETIIKIAGLCIVKISRQKINAKLVSGFQLGEGVPPGGLEALRPLAYGPQSDIPCALLGHAERFQHYSAG